MTIEQIKLRLNDYAKDMKLNLSTVLTQEGAPGLTLKQIYCLALACAYALEQAELSAALRETAGELLSATDIQATKAAATIMAMNNVYYRFLHVLEKPSYDSMPPRLRMNIMGNPGIDRIDFEIAILGVSILSGCGRCIQAHEEVLIKAGLSEETIQSIARIASVVKATATALAISHMDE